MKRKKTLRIVSYAINGRGMGHLTRQIAILRWVRRICALLDIRSEVWILTSSEADTLARREGFLALKIPSKAMLRDANVDPARYLAIARAWVVQTLTGLQPDLLLVDTFPAGSFGELIAALELAPQRALVARRVRPEFEAEPSYQALLPLYQTVVRPDVEGTGPIAIRERSELYDRASARKALGIPTEATAVWVTLGGGGDLAAPGILPGLVGRLRDRGWHVVVGAGPLYQGPEVRGDGITWLTRYTPVELLPAVDVAVSAGGYNTFHELMMVGVPTVFLPQPRIADDQGERVDRAVAAGAGIRASSVQEVPDAVQRALGLEDAGAAARSLVPTNGAKAAALSVLSSVVPSEDLQMADELLTPDLLRLIEQTRGSRKPPQATARALELVRLLSGGTPESHRRERATLADLRARGHDVPEVADPGLGRAQRTSRFVELCTEHAVPMDHAQPLLAGLAKKFRSADGAELLAAAEALFPVFARFDDWMGAISLLRAIPTQRGYRLADFVDDITPWLARHDDLFDAVRDLTRLEAGGERTVAECLQLLTNQAEAP